MSATNETNHPMDKLPAGVQLVFPNELQPGKTYNMYSHHGANNWKKARGVFTRNDNNRLQPLNETISYFDNFRYLPINNEQAEVNNYPVVNPNNNDVVQKVYFFEHRPLEIDPTTPINDYMMKNIIRAVIANPADREAILGSSEGPTANVETKFNLR